MEASGPAPKQRAAAASSQSEPAELDEPNSADVAVADDAAEDVAGATSFLQRAQLRRRLRYLGRRREVALRDLGGFVLESHRQGQDRPDLLSEKLTELERVDDERERLERALGERQELIVLREPGITTCSRCSTLHGSEDRFCPSCGTAAPTRAQRSAAGKTAAQ